MIRNNNFASLSHRFRDMFNFRLKNAHFHYPPLFDHKFENVSLALPVPPHLARKEFRHRTNYSCKIFPLPPNA